MHQQNRSYLHPFPPRHIPEMRPICLPMQRKPDMIHQVNGKTSDEEPEDYNTVAVSSLISKFETNSSPSPKKPSLIKSKSFSAKGSKRVARTNQTQDDVLHNKTNAEVEEIKNLGVRDLRRKFEEIKKRENNITVVRAENHVEEEQSPLESLTRQRLEHFKRLTKKWEREVGELLRYLNETGDFDIFNVRMQDLELSINRDFHGLKVKAEEVAAPPEVATPPKKIEIEPLSHVAKITSLYEIKSKESIEDKPRTPTQTPKRLPWTSGTRTPRIKEKDKEIEHQQEEEEVKSQEAIVEEEKQEEIVIETPQPEEKGEEPSGFIDTEHLKSASLITSYFNSLSNVNSRNNETLKEATPEYITTEAKETTLEQEATIEENPYIKEDSSLEITPEDEREEPFNESSNLHDSAIERDFEKYYSEDLKPTGSEERLFEDYYRENVLQDSIPEETEEEIRVKYEEEAAETNSAVVEDNNGVDETPDAQVSYVEDGDDGLVFEVKIEEEAPKAEEETAKIDENENRVTKDIVIVDEIPDEQATSNINESQDVEQLAAVEEQKEETYEAKIDEEQDRVVVAEELPAVESNDQQPEIQSKQEEIIVDKVTSEKPEDEATRCVRIIEEPSKQESVVENVKNEEPVAEENVQDSYVIEDDQEAPLMVKIDEEPTPELRTSEEPPASISANDRQTARIDENVVVEEISPDVRFHNDQDSSKQEVEGSCLKKYIMDTSEFLNHEQNSP